MIIDPDRAPLVQEAFDLYATGNWTLHSLAEHLEARGLRSRPTPKRGPQPLRMTSIHKLLKNIYYTGIVEYCGRRVPGRHKRLIDPDTFDLVQALLASRAIAGDRPSKHHHYLRGTLYCAECGGRLLYGKYRGRGGVYEYFSCINRTARRPNSTCDTPHYPVHAIEEAIQEHYRTVHLSKTVRETVWADVTRDADDRAAVVKRDIDRHRRKTKTLEESQARLVQLSYRELVSEEVLASEQQRLETEKRQVGRLLRQAELQMQEIKTALDGALSKTKTPHATYRASTPLERRLLNQTFFKRILVSQEGQVVGTTLTPVYAALAAWNGTLGQPQAPIAAHRRAPKTPVRTKANPDPSSSGRGLPFDSMVETVGIEPTSAIAYEWLLRA